jgi:UDP-glucuronate decarboxylase
MSKEILVTGGAGFVGTALCEVLLGQGHTVTCLDNYITGTAHNVERFRDHPRFKLIEADIDTPLTVRADEVYNLACPASPVHYQRDPIGTMRTCVLGAINVLELAAKTGAKVFQASTSEVYGDAEMHPQRETYWGNVNPIGIRSCYDEGKRAAETLFFDYHRHRGVAIRVARIFNTYGPNMQIGDGRVVSNFIVQALSGTPLTVYGEGLQTRSLCYVDDLVDGFIRLMAYEGTGPINLGNPEEITMLQLAELVISMTGSKSRIEFLPLPKDDPRQRQPDISLAKSQLGWAPKTALKDGLAKTIEFFDSELRIANPIDQRAAAFGH